MKKLREKVKTLYIIKYWFVALFKLLHFIFLHEDI